jgi:hypothetical protein
MIYLFICAFVGMLFSFTRKYISLRRQGKSIDLAFTPKQYFLLDYDVMFMQLLSVFGLMLVWNTVILPAKPKWDAYAELIFLTYGGIGSEALSLWLGKAQSHITTLIKNFTPDNKV